MNMVFGAAPVALLAILLSLPTPRLSAQATASKAIATKMVAAYRAYRPPEPFVALATTISKDQEAKIDSVVKAAQAASGQSLSGQELMSFLFATRAWFVKHGMSVEASTVDYAARIQALDAPTLNDWTAAAMALGVGPKDGILLTLAIVFNDPLWSGSAWKVGHPQAAVARLRALPVDAAAAWVGATSTGEFKFMAVYPLLTVDQLWVSNVFQAARFQAALSDAKILLAQ